jgi:hypothetical protein
LEYAIMPQPAARGTRSKPGYVVFALAAAALSATIPALAAKGRFSEWTSIQHPRRGFMIAYPSAVFEPKAGPNSEDGQVLVSRDGNAKLLVGTFENSAAFTLQAYRDYLLQESYSGAKVDYEKMKDRWFVISGTRDGTMFYERVSFTCGGKLVNSWAMLYPVAERRFYDRVVEAVASTYSPGAGPNGQCD